jgi:cysteine desulfurase
MPVVKDKGTTSGCEACPWVMSPHTHNIYFVQAKLAKRNLSYYASHTTMQLKKEQSIYLDYAAATPLDPQVLKAMQPFFTSTFGNPSALHDYGMEAKDVITNAKKNVGKILGCLTEEIIFTSSGTEANNLALQGVARAYKDKGNHIIISAIEHPSIIETANALEQVGFVVTRLPVDETGIVSPDLTKAITDKTILVSIMYANNEIGTVQQIKKITAFLKKHHPNILFHTDACQAGGALPLSVHQLGVDLLTLNGSKIYGPKGVGMLYVNRRVTLLPILHGGGQENNRRSGTENIPGIIGFAKALEIAESKRKDEVKRLEKLRNNTITEIIEKIPGAYLTGSPKHRLANNIHFTIDDVDGETLVLYLNKEGIATSTGAACSINTVKPSHVLKALDYSDEEALTSIRFTLGRNTTKKEVNILIMELANAVKKIRSLPH